MLGFFLGKHSFKGDRYGKPPHLYDTLVLVLSQHAKGWLQRHLKTLAWMMVGLIQSGWISLSAWAPYAVVAHYAGQVRRFRRWLDNDKIAIGS